jgi:hypothetical protein
LPDAAQKPWFDRAESSPGLAEKQFGGATPREGTDETRFRAAESSQGNAEARLDEPIVALY